MKILFLIPARGGSKGIPDKNIVELAGRPLIQWTISAVCESGLGGRILVSTDSEKIARMAAGFGAEAPFLRPAKLAADDTPSRDVLIHALDWLEKTESYSPDYVMLLQPTSPLRTAEDIRQAWSLAHDSRADAVISVTAVQDHPFWCKSIRSDGTIAQFQGNGSQITRRQDLPPVYALNGAIYLLSLRILRDQASLCPEGARAYVMPRERSIDIDTPFDLKLAEAVIGLS